MDPQRLPGNVSALKTAVPSPSSKGERRLNKRYTSDQLSLMFMGADHAALNWSLGGVLVADRHPHLAVGSTISGILSVRGYGGRFQFSAELVRRDVRTKELAFRFISPSRALLDTLSRITATT
jgi:hypothetical protein